MPDCTSCPVYASPLFRTETKGQVSLSPCVFHPSQTLVNQSLYAEASPAEHLFALHSGLIKMVRSLESGKERIIRIVFPGAVFGFEVLASDSFAASAVAVQKSEVCSIGSDELAAHLRTNPEFALNLVRLLAKEITHLSIDLSSMSFKDARTRVATLLYSVLPAEAKNEAEGAVLKLPFSCQEIGEMLEISPETVSRSWNSLERDGVIKKRGRRVTVQNVGALERACRR
jgi:CRP-like cAMP-binding protein